MKLLNDMYRDGYFPDFLVDKIKDLLENLITFLEKDSHSIESVQAKLDGIVVAINNLDEEFGENGSELETVARESIADSIYNILKKFDVNIEIEEAIRMRDW